MKKYIRLIPKINERFKVFETTMQKSFIEQVTRMEGRFKDHISRCDKQTQEVAKKVDSLEIKIQADATETQRQVNRLDASIVETRSNIDSNKEGVLQALNDEILKVRQEVRRRSAPNILVQGPVDEKNRVYFTGENNENPIEFLLACESEMARVGSRLEDQDKIQWVVNAMRDSARKWYNIVRDRVSTYAEFKQNFESRYWNSHTQRLLRNELEYGSCLLYTSRCV